MIYRNIGKKKSEKIPLPKYAPGCCKKLEQKKCLQFMVQKALVLFLNNIFYWIWIYSYLSEISQMQLQQKHIQIYSVIKKYYKHILWKHKKYMQGYTIECMKEHRGKNIKYIW